MTLSCAVAYIVSMAFEAPMMGLEKVLLRPKATKDSTTPPALEKYADPSGRPGDALRSNPYSHLQPRQDEAKWQADDNVNNTSTPLRDYSYSHDISLHDTPYLQQNGTDDCPVKL